MLKGNVLRACVTPASLYGLEKVALTEQQHRLQVCENNWVRRITRTNRVGRSKMRCSLIGRLLRSWMRWAGQFERMDADKPAKRAEMEKTSMK